MSEKIKAVWERHRSIIVPWLFYLFPGFPIFIDAS